MNDHTLSRRLSYLLRHAPHEAGLTLAPGGWVPLAPVLIHLSVTRAQVEAVVAGSDKGRFSLRGDHIRANQGHSVPVDLQLTPATPPALLYHGTHAGALAAIRAEGLRAMNRHHVHLSPDPDTACRVGARRGPPVVLTVRAGEMHAAGHAFLVSENGVWLTDTVPPAFIHGDA
ncbi:RNA 2'-phosphotransferase [Deinococcus aquiradiocola]|uniref:Probable RNA 2'-phosphotransferase n=1 Tax=Deinococcus aquiradiocola TaxID=393059 RepID=A0A917UVB1_9DEIO|nr:RNA 2'-phosphotransferase [Deinococcus aquiradiocola]GGJ87363.1 putative RNA 2'-phosphotransferase [Deinococcus aquiradiocola]